MYNVSSSGMDVNHGSAHSRFAIVYRRRTSRYVVHRWRHSAALLRSQNKPAGLVKYFNRCTYMCRTWWTYGLFVSYLSLRISLLCGKDTIVAWGPMHRSCDMCFFTIRMYLHLMQSNLLSSFRLITFCTNFSTRTFWRWTSLIWGGAWLLLLKLLWHLTESVNFYNFIILTMNLSASLGKNLFFGKKTEIAGNNSARTLFIKTLFSQTKIAFYMSMYIYI